jgi:hypothetical protein
MHAHEKLGSTRVNVNRINAFCAYVKQCGFIDLGYNGPAYTWTNKRFTYVPTYERLDRCLGNAEWCKVFPSTTIYHLPMMYSDHAPILAVLIPPDHALINLFVLKIGGSGNRNFKTLLNKVGNTLLLVISHTKLSFLLKILGNGGERNPTIVTCLLK